MDWRRLLAGGGRVALVAAIVIALLALFTALSWLHAILAIGVIAIVALWSSPAQGRLQSAESSRRRGRERDEALLHAVMEGWPEPAILLDGAGRVLALNAAAKALAPALRIGEPALFALRNPQIVAALRACMAQGTTQRAEFVERVPLDRWYALQVAPLVPAGARGGERPVLLTFHDLTPLRRVEEMRADFVANASHELRTPLAALSGFIETLQGPARNDEAARTRFLGIMRAQATRMARLIDDLLSLSRIELSAHVRPQAAVDVAGVIKQVADGLEAIAQERGVTLHVATPDVSTVVPGDRDELLRLFENLIENALKYGAAGKRVEVAFAHNESPEREPELRVHVRDYGPGIAPEHMPRLTERFYRVDVGESRAQGGTGLGLSLVKHILNHHRGRLLIDSRPGAGACFTACLPLQLSSSKNI